MKTRRRMTVGAGVVSPEQSDATVWSGRLGLAPLLAYAGPRLSFSLVLLPMFAFIIPYYGGELGLPLTSVGVAMFISRLVNTLAAPLIGALSDGSRSRFGRRRPFIVGGLPILIVGVWLLYVPPPGVGVIYLTAVLCVVSVAVTVVHLPYNSWGAELSGDYDERSRIVGLREAAGVIGNMLTFAVPITLAIFDRPSLGEALLVLAVLSAVLLPLQFGWAVLRTPEPHVAAPLGVRTEWRDVVKLVGNNRPFLILFASTFPVYIATAVGGGLNWSVMSDGFASPRLAPVWVLIENLTLLVGAPFWIRYGERHGKHRAIAVGALCFAALSLPVPFLPVDAEWTAVVVLMLRGLTLASFLIVPFSLFADIIDVDTAASGEQRTGLYAAIEGVAINVALAVGAAAAAFLPAILGYQPGDSSPSAAGLFGLKATHSWLPAILLLLIVPLYWRFPLTRERHAELRAEIERGAMVRSA